MESKQNRNKDWQPGAIKESKQALTGQKLTQRCHVLNGLRALAAWFINGLLEHGREQLAVHAGIQMIPEPNQNGGPGYLQQRQRYKEEYDDQRKHQQGLYASTAEGSVVYLQHV